MSKGASHIGAWLPGLVLAGLVVAYMLPRLIDARFGLFDDGSTLASAQQIAAGRWVPGDEQGTGRFWPLAWLYFGLIYSLAGANATAFYLGNTVLLMALVLGVSLLAQRLSGSAVLGWFSGLLLLLSGPTVETAYTLSKRELLQSVWFVAWLLALWAAQSRRGASQGRLLVVGAGLAALSNLTKETGLLLTPVTLAWVASLEVLRRLGRAMPRAATRFARHAALTALAGNALYLALRAVFVEQGLLQGNYTNNFEFSAARVLFSSRVWLDWLNRDYLFVAPLVLLPALAVLRARWSARLGLVGGCAIWMAAWLALYLPWLYTPEYYLFPLALGAAVAVPALGAETLDAARALGGRWRWTGTALIACSAGLFLLTLPPLITNARAQIVIDHANDEAVEFVSREAPAGARVLVNIQDPREFEYVHQMGILLRRVLGRGDLSVQEVNLAADLPSSSGETWILSPFMENQFYPSVRMGVYEHTSREYQASVEEAYGARLTLLHEIRQSARSMNIDNLRLFCPLTPSLGYCQAPNTPVDGRVFAYGWRIYRLEPPSERMP